MIVYKGPLRIQPTEVGQKVDIKRAVQRKDMFPLIREGYICKERNVIDELGVDGEGCANLHIFYLSVVQKQSEM